MVRREPADAAVSPVVGMVLVLGISIVGIAAILYWGLPAIDEMKANVEHKSMEAQFMELDSTIKELVAGTTEKTAKRWNPSVNRGQMYLVNETEGWVYATEKYHLTKDYNLLYSGFGDGNGEFTMRNTGEGLNPATLQADRINGTATAETLTVERKEGSNWVPWGAVDWTTASSIDVRLKDSSGAVIPIKNATIRLRTFDASVQVAEAFYVPSGRVDFILETSLGTKTLTQNNGAVISGNGQTSAMLNPPPIPPVADTAGKPRAFARALLLNATGSFAGDDQFSVLVTLYSTSTLASYDCVKSDASDCVESTKLFLFGKNREVWKTYLTNAGRGYSFSTSEAAIDPANEVYLHDRRPATKMGYTLLQSTVQLTTG